jgi:hypothetical protein
MDSLGIKPPPSTASRSLSLRDPIAVREANETELGPAKAPSAMSDGGTRNREHRRHQGSFAYDLIDPKNAEALLGAAEHQPDAAATRNQVLMRQRAYHNATPPKQPADRAADLTNDPHADLQV